jgi:hypothetical protein
LQESPLQTLSPLQPSTMAPTSAREVHAMAIPKLRAKDMGTSTWVVFGLRDARHGA